MKKDMHCRGRIGWALVVLMVVMAMAGPVFGAAAAESERVRVDRTALQLVKGQDSFVLNVTLKEGTPFAGAEFAVKCPDGMVLRKVTYDQDGTVVGPVVRNGVSWFSFFAGENRFRGTVAAQLTFSWKDDENTALLLDHVNVYRIGTSVEKDGVAVGTPVFISRAGADNEVTPPAPMPPEAGETESKQDGAGAGLIPVDRDSGNGGTKKPGSGTVKKPGNSTVKKPGSSTVKKPGSVEPKKNGSASAGSAAGNSGSASSGNAGGTSTGSSGSVSSGTAPAGAGESSRQATGSGSSLLQRIAAGGGSSAGQGSDGLQPGADSFSEENSVLGSAGDAGTERGTNLILWILLFVCIVAFAVPGFLLIQKKRREGKTE